MAQHPYYWSTSLLLDFEGSGATITDISPTPKTPSSVNGDATQSALQAKTGAKSLKLDGTGDWIDYASHADFDFDSGPFTVSCWFRPAALGINQGLFNYTIDAASNDTHVAWHIRVTTANKVDATIYIGGVKKTLLSTTALALDTWAHIEYSRSATGLCTLRINGVVDPTPIVYAGVVQTPASRLMRIGKYSASNPFYPNGYMDGVVIVKGVEVHTADFIPEYEVYEVPPPPAGSADVTLPMFTGESFGGAYSEMTLPMLQMKSSGGASAEVLLPMFGIRATGHDATGERVANVVLPMFQIETRGGAVAQMNLPMFNIEATGTVPVTIEARVMLPMFDIEASGTTTTVGSARVTLPMFTGRGVAGGNASVDIPMFAIESGGTTGIIGQASVILPMFDIDARGTAGVVITAHVVLPMIETVRPSSAHVTLPMFGIVAIGHATVTMTYEAYSMNLKPSNKAGIHEVTHWTNIPFDGIVRHGTKYYGWGPQGLHLIGGALDGATPIPWAWHTAITDFGTSQRKFLRELVLSGRIGPSAVASVSVGERADTTYSYSTPRGQLAQNYRVKTGRGLKDAYYKFGLSGTDVGDVDSVSFGTAEGTRRI